MNKTRVKWINEQNKKNDQDRRDYEIQGNKVIYREKMSGKTILQENKDPNK